MESQIQIQSEAVEIVIPSGNDPANSSVVDRSRQQRQQATPATPSASAGQQKPQPHHQNQQGPNVSRVLIVSPSVQHQQQSSMHSMTTRSANDRKLVAVSHHQSGGQMHHQVVQRQIVIQQPSSSPKCSSGEGPAPCYVLSNGQQQAATTATVQNGQLVLANLTSENRGRPRVQQQQHQVHRQQQILIIQQADRRTDELDKVDDPQSQEHSLPLGVAQTITVAVSDADGRGGDGTPAAIYPALQYVASSGEPVIAGAHHIVAAHHHSNSAAGATGAPSAADASHVIYHHSPVTASNQHSAVHLQSGAYAVYPGDTGGYSPQGHHYYAGQVSYQTTPLHSPTSTYIIQSSGGGLQHSPVGGGCNPVLGIHEDEAAAQQLSHTTRASPATIQWLLQNYETAEGVSLPRCTLYNHYLKHCSEHKLDPVNAASFGKLIRSVFLGLRTRRLGTRGNSKYHYYGIRIKPDSPLNRISDESMATMAMRQQPTNQSRRPRPMLSTPPAPSVQQQTNVSTASTMQGQQASLAASSSVVPHQSLSGEPGSDSGTPNSIQSNNATAATLPVASGQQQQQHQHQAGSASDGNKQYVGEGVVPDVMPPPLEHLESSFDRLGLTLENADKFFSAYRNHCEDILECVKNLLFSEVERCWRQFWQPEDVHGSKQRSPLDQEVESDLEDEDSMEHNSSGLTRMQLYSLCTLPVVQEFVQTMDFQFYQVLVDVLAPNVLKPIPGTLTQSIRNFAKRLESGLGLALQGAPDVILRIKLDAVGSLAQTLRRYTSLNHLAQAARAVLQNSAQIQQMLTDLNRVDFHNVQEQASWVCDCDPNIVDQIEKDFKNALERQKTLEHWGSWLETVVDQILGSYDVMNVVNGRQEHDASVVRLTSVARQFLLKWSFYSSMVMRDLTLRSAPSFGSFHLIRLLYDEYMFYLVEQRVARLTGQTTIAVMSQSYRNHVASLASGEQDYQAYQMHQQDNEDGRADQHGQECVMQPNHICHPLQHQFMCQQSAAGDASLTSMDQAGSDAVVAMTCSHGNTAGAGVVSYALSACPESTQSGEGRMEETEERNVVDEYFITMQEEQQGQRQSDTTNQPNTPVLSNTTPTQSTVDWGREQEGEESVAQGPVKTSGVLELSSPVKKRKMSLKFNGDSNAE